MLHVKSLLIFYLLKSTRQVFVCASQKVVIVVELTWTLQLIPGQECIVSTCSTCLSYSTCCFSYVLNYKYSNWDKESDYDCYYELGIQSFPKSFKWSFPHFLWVWLSSLLCTSWRKKKREKNPETWSCNRKLVRCYPFLRCRSELSKGIFKGAKGLLMNRHIIDLWTKQSLIMCGWKFNWGSERRSLLAKLMHGQEWREFDWALCHWGKGWDTNDHSANASGFSLLPFSAQAFLCLLSSAACVIQLFLCFQIRRKCLQLTNFPHLGVLFCHLFNPLLPIFVLFFSLYKWQELSV